jgi:hypothetical protein
MTGGNELNGNWDVHRTGGALPPMRGMVRKQIENGRGWTIAAGVRIPFVVDGLSLRYPFGLVDELVPTGPDTYDGTAKLFGRAVGTFRLTRAPRATSPVAAPRTRRRGRRGERAS